MNANPQTAKPAVPTVPWTVLAPCGRYVLRAAAARIAEVAAFYGWPGPDKMLRARRSGGRSSLWLGPDEWLLLDEPGEASPAPSAASGIAHSWVNVSERQAALQIAGPTATEWLAAACPLDLAIESFAVHACTRTVFGRCEIVLWRTDQDSFRLECWRSYLPYVQGLLQSAL